MILLSLLLIMIPIRMKDHAKTSTVVRKSNTRTYTPPEQIKVEPSIAMVEDLLADNIDGHVIYFCEQAANIARPDAKIHRPVVGMPIISVKVGYCCYHGLCDMGDRASAIPHSLYKEIMHAIVYDQDQGLTGRYHNTTLKHK